MSEYTPDKWVVVKITSDNQTPIHTFLLVGMVVG